MELAPPFVGLLESGVSIINNGADANLLQSRADFIVGGGASRVGGGSATVGVGSVSVGGGVVSVGDGVLSVCCDIISTGVESVLERDG